MPRCTFVHVPVPNALQLLHGTSLGHAVYYAIWQIAAFRMARRLHREVAFDLVHHVTYVSSWQPSWLGWLGVPFIWSMGPIDKTPWRFLRFMSWRSQIAEIVRNVGLSVLAPLTRLVTGSRASLILCASDPDPWKNGLPITRFPMGGLGPDELTRLAHATQRSRGPFRIASIGLLRGWKGFALGLHAFARLRVRHPDSEYWIIGDGPERQFLERLARRLGCADAVRFWGVQPRDAIFGLLGEIDVLLHPSLHEQFGYVLVEAMAAGRPVICLGVGGPAVLVGAECGATIPPDKNPTQIVSRLADALNEFAASAEKCASAGESGRRRIEQTWIWSVRGSHLLALYERIAVSARAKGP
jgi:glycosyltransferase involved in cell wall biosynthesis